MRRIAIWAVETLMDFLAWPVGIWDWPPAGWYQWVAMQWLYPLEFGHKYRPDRSTN